MRIVWTAPAVSDIAAIRTYVAASNPAAAREQVARVIQSVSMLAEFPDIGRLGRRIGTRELVVMRTPFLVAYRPLAEQVEILRVLHARQRWPDRL